MAKGDNKPIKIAKDEPVTVRFRTQAVVASWWVHLLADKEVVRTWHGVTTDAAADEAIIPAGDLKSGRNLFWQLALFGSVHSEISYQMEIEFWQSGAKLGSDKEQGKVPKSKTKGLSGIRRVDVGK